MKEISTKSQKLLEKIEIILAKINNRKPLSQDELKAIQKWFTISYTYHTNAIEGNTLTLQETKLILEDGITVGGKPLREIFGRIHHKPKQQCFSSCCLDALEYYKNSPFCRWKWKNCTIAFKF